MEIAVNKNNSVERKNKDFKYQYLHKFKDISLWIYAGAGI